MTSLTERLDLERGPHWNNRFALAPMTNRQSFSNGAISDDELAWLVGRASGGFGLVMTCAAHVTEDGQGWPGELGIWNDAHLSGLARLAAGIKEAGAVSSVQLHHGGRRADDEIVVEKVAPWDDRETGARALETSEIEELVEAFGQAAGRAQAAGVDGVEVHGAHGYLIAQFLDSERNVRTDGYGGDHTGRERFLLEVIDSVRRHTSDDFQVGLRLSPERNGIRIDDAKKLARSIMLSGQIDFLDMSLWDVFAEPAEPIADRRPLIEQFVEVERGRTRLGVAGRISNALDAQRCLNLGADFVSIGTAAILHHDFPTRAANNPRFAAVTPPVSSEHLRAEMVGDEFVRYLREIREDFVLP